MLFLILGRSVGLKKRNQKKKIISSLRIGGLVPQHHSCGARKTTRREPKINMAEKLVDFVAKLRQRGKKDQPPKLLWDIKMVLKRRFFLFFVFFFYTNDAILNGEKKGDGLTTMTASLSKAKRES